MITVVVLVAGCGGDDDAWSESSPSDVTTATDTTSATTPASDATQATDPPATDPPATDPPGGDVSADPGAIPAEMCPDGAWPMVAAYDIETGGVRWAACEPGGGLFLMAAAAQDTVWVTFQGRSHSSWRSMPKAAPSCRRGDEARFAREVPDNADVPVVSPPLIDGVQLAGGQDDPMTGTDAATGELRWTQPGRMVYDDVWAVGDGAVFAVESLPSSPTRWRQVTCAGAEIWPSTCGRGTQRVSGCW